MQVTTKTKTTVVVDGIIIKLSFEEAQELRISAGRCSLNDLVSIGFTPEQASNLHKLYFALTQALNLE